MKNEILTTLKFKKDEITEKLELVSREEHETLKKIITKQEKEIQQIKKN